jgi:hypothetical protein
MAFTTNVFPIGQTVLTGTGQIIFPQNPVPGETYNHINSNSIETYTYDGSCWVLMSTNLIVNSTVTGQYPNTGIAAGAYPSVAISNNGTIGRTSFTGGNQQILSLSNMFLNSASMKEYIPKRLLIGLDLSNNQIYSLNGISDIINELRGELRLKGNHITAGGLGLLRIRGLRGVVYWTDAIEADKFCKAATIINKYLPEGDIFDCQEELIEAGLEEYAEL